MESLPKVLVGVHLHRCIVTYPVDKVIRSLNNWGLRLAFGHCLKASFSKHYILILSGPVATPATPTPTGGFNFASGSIGIVGSPFGSPASGPAFGAPSTPPPGANSTLTARTRARSAARRRGKK